MDSEPIVTARGFLEDHLEARGRVWEEALLDRPVILAIRPFMDRFVAADTLPPHDHPLYEGLLELGPALVKRSPVQSSRAAIEMEEFRVLGVPEVIHLGLAGSLRPDLPIGGIVVTEGALNETGPALFYGHPLDSLIPSDPGLTSGLGKWLCDRGLEVISAPHWTTDVLCLETLEKVVKYRALGAVCVEMEAGGLFAAAARYGLAAAAVYVISDVLGEDGWLRGWHSEDLREGVAAVLDALLDDPAGPWTGILSAE